MDQMSEKILRLFREAHKDPEYASLSREYAILEEKFALLTQKLPEEE